MKQRRKGKRVELEIVHTFQQHGIDAKRVPLSGSTYLKGDIFAQNQKQQIIIEVKARRKSSKQLQMIVELAQKHEFLILEGEKGIYQVETLEKFIARFKNNEKLELDIDGDVYVYDAPKEIEDWYNFDLLIVKLDYMKPIAVKRRGQ